LWSPWPIHGRSRKTRTPASQTQRRSRFDSSARPHEVARRSRMLGARRITPAGEEGGPAGPGEPRPARIREEEGRRGEEARHGRERPAAGAVRCEGDEREEEEDAGRGHIEADRAVEPCGMRPRPPELFDDPDHRRASRGDEEEKERGRKLAAVLDRPERKKERREKKELPQLPRPLGRAAGEDEGGERDGGPRRGAEEEGASRSPAREKTADPPARAGREHDGDRPGGEGELLPGDPEGEEEEKAGESDLGEPPRETHRVLRQMPRER